MTSPSGGAEIVQVVAGIDPAHGGPAYSVPRLNSALVEHGQMSVLFAVAHSEFTKESELIRYFSHDFQAMPGLSLLRCSQALQQAISARCKSGGIVHSHGLWLMPNVYAGRCAQAAGRPLMVSPRGMLSTAALAFSAWRKRLFWRLLQGPAYADAACYHATSAMEAEEIRAFGIRAPIVVIPNGVDLPTMPMPSARPKTLLALGRLHPKKGLDDLIVAWAQLAALRPDWSLRIVGPSEDGHDVALRELADRLGAPRVEICGPVYGEEKWREYAQAQLFVLPTRSENFGLVVAEALSAGLPAVVSRGAPWAGLQTYDCGWWVEHGVGALRHALAEATTLPESRRVQMGENGRAWVKREFAWSAIAQQFTRSYAWLGGQAPPPEELLWTP